MISFNPFHFLKETPLAPHSKTLRSTFVKKTNYFFTFLYGSIVPNKNGQWKQVGLFDYLTLFILKATQYAAVYSVEKLMDSKKTGLKIFWGICAFLSILLSGSLYACIGFFAIPLLAVGMAITGIVHLVSQHATRHDHQLIAERLQAHYATEEELERVQNKESIIFERVVNPKEYAFIAKSSACFVSKDITPFEKQNKSCFVFEIPENPNAMPQIYFYSKTKNTLERLELRTNGGQMLKNFVRDNKIGHMEYPVEGEFSHLTPDKMRLIRECVIQSPDLQDEIRIEYALKRKRNVRGQLSTNNLQDKAFFKALYRLNWGQFTVASNFKDNEENLWVAQRFLS